MKNDIQDTVRVPVWMYRGNGYLDRNIALKKMRGDCSEIHFIHVIFVKKIDIVTQLKSRGLHDKSDELLNLWEMADNE